MLDQVRTLSKEEVFELRKKIRPLKNDVDGYYFANCSGTGPIKASYGFGDTAVLRRISSKKLETLYTGIMILPVTGYYGLFKPSEEEVLNRIPVDLFDVVDCYLLDSSDMSRSSIIFDDDGERQKCPVGLYKEI